MSEFIEHENKWKSYWILSENEKVMFKLRLLAEHLEWAEFEIGDQFNTFDDGVKWALEWTEHQYPYFITSLTTDEEHCGDCRNQCCSCTKCSAEDIWKKVIGHL